MMMRLGFASAAVVALMSVPAATVPHAYASDASGLTGVVRSVARTEASAVVWLEAPGLAAKGRTERVVLTQHGLMFDPKLLVVQTGTVVEFPNEDRVFHNVFSFHDGKRFDLGTYPVGSTRRVTFKAAGVSRIFCNIHPHMAAYIVAVDSPYYAVVKPDGTFAISDVPAGRYTYHAWRPSSEPVTGTVVLPASTPLEVAWR